MNYRIFAPISLFVSILSTLKFEITEWDVFQLYAAEYHKMMKKWSFGSEIDSNLHEIQAKKTSFPSPIFLANYKRHLWPWWKQNKFIHLPLSKCLKPPNLICIFCLGTQKRCKRKFMRWEFSSFFLFYNNKKIAVKLREKWRKIPIILGGFPLRVHTGRYFSSLVSWKQLIFLHLPEKGTLVIFLG